MKPSNIAKKFLPIFLSVFITSSIYPLPSNVCSEKAFSHPYAQKLRQLQECSIPFQRIVRWLHGVGHGNAGL